MILDARELPDGHSLTADICVVGAGAAGISLALEFANTRFTVLILESGGLKPEKATQDLYSGTVVDERLHSLPDRYRQRRFGGTTTIWGGRCMPFDAIDFEARDYVQNSGWPIALEALLAFYPKANQLCEAGTFDYTSTSAFNKPLRPMIDGFRSQNFSTDTLERFSCPTDFGVRYRSRLEAAQNVRILLHANVTSLDLDKDGQQLNSVTVTTMQGKRINVGARQFVLANGGLEVARLMLASRSVHANGIGNHHDVLGRYYMCHIAGTVGALTIRGPLDSVWNGYDISDEGVYCRRRIALNATSQREYRTGNFVARLHHPRITDPAHRNSILSSLYLAKFLIPYEYGKRLHGDERADLSTWLKHIGNLSMGPFDAAKFAWHMLKDRRLADRKFPSIIIKSKANLYSIDFHAEQEPNPHSRVTLDQSVDALGMPRLQIDWRYSKTDVHTVAKSLELLTADIVQSGIGKLDYDPANLEYEMTRYGAYGGHHIGTARMGINSNSSVVDANCKVHGIDNLHIASAAVFTTSSQANPTLTIIALTLRLAQRLKDTLLTTT